MIRGHFGSLSGSRVPLVPVSVVLPGIVDRWRTVDFLVDTGCTHSILQPNDAAENFGIPRERLQQPALWPAAIAGQGIGGSARLFPVQALYRFVDEQGRFEDMEGQILIAQLVSANEVLPSLLGWDVLKEFDISLNQRAGTVTLRRL